MSLYRAPRQKPLALLENGALDENDLEHTDIQNILEKLEEWEQVLNTDPVQCPCPLKLNHLLVSKFDGKEGGYGEETVF